MKSKLPALLLSLVVAMGLWLYVVTSVSPESDQIYSGIPVVFENETSLLDRELMLVSGENATVSVRLYGKRANLNRLNASNIIVTVDLRAVTEPGKYELEYKVSYPSGITNAVSYTHLDVYKRQPQHHGCRIRRRRTRRHVPCGHEDG